MSIVHIHEFLLAIKNPAHRLLHTIGVNYGVDDHWPRRKGSAERASRRFNLRRGA